VELHGDLLTTIHTRLTFLFFVRVMRTFRIPFPRTSPYYLACHHLLVFHRYRQRSLIVYAFWPMLFERVNRPKFLSWGLIGSSPMILWGFYPFSPFYLSYPSFFSYPCYYFCLCLLGLFLCIFPSNECSNLSYEQSLSHILGTSLFQIYSRPVSDAPKGCVLSACHRNSDRLRLCWHMFL